MRQRVQLRFAEWHRRLLHRLAEWQRRDPPAWVVTLVGMALGFGVFVFLLAVVGTLRVAAYVAKSLR